MMKQSDLLSLHLDSFLTHEYADLFDFLFESDLIDECRQDNKQLTKFLTRPDVLQHLVETAVTGSNESLELLEQYRRSHIASEILSCPQIGYTLIRDAKSLEMLYLPLLNEDLPSLMASFVYKIFSSFIQLSTEEICTFFIQRPDLTRFILANLSRPAVLDLICRLLQISPDMGCKLADSDVIHTLLARLTVTHSDEVHVSAVQFLARLLASVRLLSLSRYEVTESSRNPLRDKLESQETVQTLVSCMFKDPDSEEIDRVCSDSLLISGIFYLRCLIDPTTCTDTGPELPPLPNPDGLLSLSDSVISTVCSALIPHLGAFKQRLIANPPGSPLLDAPDYKTAAVTTARLHTIRFLHLLLLIDSESVVQEIVRLDLCNTFMDLFFQYPMNSFLHSTCEGILRLIILRAVAVTSKGPLQSSTTSPPAGISFSSTDTLHKMLLGSLGSDAESLATGACEQPEVSEMESPESGQNIYWSILHRLIVHGNLLSRIMNTWLAECNKAHRASHLGHLRLMANSLNATIGPIPDTKDPTLPRSTNPSQLVTAEHVAQVAKNGCNYESDWSPALRDFLRADIPENVWTSWCEFVSGPLVRANERSFIDYTDFPNSATSSDPIPSDEKSANLDLPYAAQCAYLNYCSRPLTVPFMDQFGVAEYDFTHSQPNLRWDLNSRLSEISFSLPVSEDTGNSRLFENACNDVFTLNGVEVGTDAQCLAEDSDESFTLADVDAANKPAEGITQAVSEPHKMNKDMPSRQTLTKVFNEVLPIAHITSGSDIARLSSIVSDSNDDDDPDLVVIENGFRKSVALTNLHEIGSNDDALSKWSQIFYQKLQAHPPRSDSDEDSELVEPDVYSPALPACNSRLGSLGLVSNQLGFHKSLCSPIPRRTGVVSPALRISPPTTGVPTSPGSHGCVNGFAEDSDEVDEHRPSADCKDGSSFSTTLFRPHPLTSGGSSVPKISGSRDNPATRTIDNVPRSTSVQSSLDTSNLDIRDGIVPPHWRRSRSLASTELYSLPVHNNLDDVDEDLENIELGDLSSGFSSLPQPNRNSFDSLPLDYGGPLPIMPTKRTASLPLNSSVPASQNAFNLIQSARKNGISGPSPNCTFVAPTATEFRTTVHRFLREPHMDSPSLNTLSSVASDNSRPLTHRSRSPSKIGPSCGVLASIKVRHADRTRTFPPFLINDDDFETLANRSEDAMKTLYRSHRTIRLRSGSEGQLYKAT